MAAALRVFRTNGRPEVSRSHVQGFEADWEMAGFGGAQTDARQPRCMEDPKGGAQDARRPRPRQDTECADRLTVSGRRL